MVREDNQRRWEVTGRGKRKGQKLTERKRRYIIARDRKRGRGCYFDFPGICLGINQPQVQVHHVQDAEDGGTNANDNLVTACTPCHTLHSARVAQRRSVAKQTEWHRRPEPHPGVLRDDEL